VTIPEAGAVRRAWLTLAAQSTLALAMVLIIVGGVAWLLLLHDEQVSEHRLLSQAVRPAARDDVTDPPPGITLFLVDPSRQLVGHTPGMPAAVFDPRGLRARPLTPVWSGRTVDGTPYRSVTVADRDGWIQAALDLSGRYAERRRVLGVGIVASLVGVLAAGGMGLLLARRAIAPLGEAIERQGRFVADASHELRTPLTLLHTRAQMARRDLLAGDLEHAREEVAALERDAGRMGEVVEDLLLSAELGGGGAERTTVDLGVLTADAATSVQGYAEGTGVRIVPDLEEVWVEGTPTALRRVVLSLLDNAIRHAAHPGGEVRVAVARDRTMAVLKVSDNGSGFDQEMAEHLFDRFAHGSGNGGRRRFGLGLALVREVVVAHGGQVEADSRPGKAPHSGSASRRRQGSTKNRRVGCRP
jgi:signal transduction histidine kinase